MSEDHLLEDVVARCFGLVKSQHPPSDNDTTHAAQKTRSFNYATW